MTGDSQRACDFNGGHHRGHHRALTVAATWNRRTHSAEVHGGLTVMTGLSLPHCPPAPPSWLWGLPGARDQTGLGAELHETWLSTRAEVHTQTPVSAPVFPWHTHPPPASAHGTFTAAIPTEEGSRAAPARLPAPPSPWQEWTPGSCPSWSGIRRSPPFPCPLRVSLSLALPVMGRAGQSGCPH